MEEGKVWISRKFYETPLTILLYPTQTWQDIVRFRYIAHCSFIIGLCNLKCIFLIKVWISLYKPNISLVLYRCGICIGCYIHLLKDLASSLRFVSPPSERIYGAALISSVMTSSKPIKILSNFGTQSIVVLLLGFAT